MNKTSKLTEGELFLVNRYELIWEENRKRLSSIEEYKDFIPSDIEGCKKVVFIGAYSGLSYTQEVARQVKTLKDSGAYVVAVDKAVPLLEMCGIDVDLFVAGSPNRMTVIQETDYTKYYQEYSKKFGRKKLAISRYAHSFLLDCEIADVMVIPDLDTERLIRRAERIEIEKLIIGSSIVPCGTSFTSLSMNVLTRFLRNLIDPEVFFFFTPYSWHEGREPSCYRQFHFLEEGNPESPLVPKYKMLPFKNQGINYITSMAYFLGARKLVEMPRFLGCTPSKIIYEHLPLYKSMMSELSINMNGYRSTEEYFDNEECPEKLKGEGDEVRED